MTDFVFAELTHRPRGLDEESLRFVFVVVLWLYTGDYTRLDLKFLGEKIRKSGPPVSRNLKLAPLPLSPAVFVVQ